MIDSDIDPKLRPEQTRFRTGRGCIVPDFPLQNITEQCIEWNVRLFTNFIVFEKAFDRVEDLEGHTDYYLRLLPSEGNFMNSSNAVLS